VEVARCDQAHHIAEYGYNGKTSKKVSVASLASFDCIGEDTSYSSRILLVLVEAFQLKLSLVFVR
jgi:hypothetical protein